ncbi:hypothetical protein N474_14625 [Pseudoalteromonas luteoviolacea CPMOR-2]|uniref:TonB family protein n=1 Tax=Pseudoalteromonas luteoviolacea TaxID=43657 RepID=UPI0007B16745|nr:TonB family protein [Pseudoalteromonas luteoviolacea]KZN55619.1 hypothetical protein N474_14625 [Pseudoalteromonas luteoviolacea CPMOR-2]
MKYFVLFLVFVLAGCSSTHIDTSSNIIYVNTETDSPAKWVVKIEPKYPTDAFEQSIEGYLKFRAVINHRGALENIEVIESSPKGVFEFEGLRALKFWRFKPALLNGKLVKVEYQDKLVWKLNN